MGRTVSVFDLSDEILFRVLDSYLDPVSVARVGGTCRRLSVLSKSRGLWERLIAPFDSADTQGQAASSMLYGSLLQPRTPGWNCDVCGNTLYVSSGSTRQRCVCVCRRVRLPLTVMGFSHQRCRSSSLSQGFDHMTQALIDNFDFNLQLVDSLPDEEALRGVDMLVLCTTEGPELTATELQNLMDFVRRGGTAVVSAFSQWSSFGHYNRKLSQWLGVTVDPHAPFLNERATLIPDAPMGPWDTLGRFINRGETEFMVDVGGGSREKRTSVYFPRGHDLTGNGQVFVCSNYHWIADPNHWNRGTFHRGMNRHLLLNLAASAAAKLRP